MAVETVYRATDGRLFTNRNDALAYDAALLRRERMMIHFRQHKPLLTDTGRMKDMVALADVLDCLVKDAAIIRTQVLI
jgi:dsDNA-binding SOS-regulon protein